MARLVSEAHRERAAVQAALRMIARGERPGYIVRSTSVESQWEIIGIPWLPIAAACSGDAIDEARCSIGLWLDIGTDDFDVFAGTASERVDLDRLI